MASFTASGHLSPVKHGRPAIEEESENGEVHSEAVFTNPFNFQPISYSIGPAPVSAAKGVSSAVVTLQDKN